MTSALTGHVIVGRTFPFYMTVTGTLPVNSYDRVIALLTGAATLTLPALATCAPGYELRIRNNSAAPQTLTVAGNGSEVIGSSNTASVTQSQSLLILADHKNSKWQIEYGPA